MSKSSPSSGRAFLDRPSLVALRMKLVVFFLKSRILRLEIYNSFLHLWNGHLRFLFWLRHDLFPSWFDDDL